ncbi:anti-sigma factor [Brevibacterium atlanticum]|uniref:anti-sigma factor n=1 Tax=Brevibacterium atlanticum TaxID=2697563 RepID=UPI0014216828|nr:anti-sigma factor [Brevibacterium atlanticum]
MSTDRDYLAAGLALGGLSDDELAEAQALADSDADFRAEVASYAEVLSETAESEDPVGISAETQAAILAVPDNHEQTDPAPADPGSVTSGPISSSGRSTSPGHTESSEPASLDAHRDRRSSGRSSRRPWMPWVAAAAAIIVVAGFGVTIWQQAQRQNELEEKLTATQQQLDESTRLMEASDLQTTTAKMPSGGSVTVLSSRSEQLIRLSPRDVVQTTSATSMQMWVIGDDGPESAGLMSSKPVTITDEKFAKGSVFGITVEPEGGSKQPTTDPIVAIDL